MKYIPTIEVLPCKKCGSDHLVYWVENSYIECQHCGNKEITDGENFKIKVADKLTEDTPIRRLRDEKKYSKKTKDS